MARTALIYRPEALKHDAGKYHPESPARLTAIMDAFKKAEIKPPDVDVKPVERKHLLRIHSEDHIDTIKNTCAKNLPYPDPDTSMVKDSWPAALLAAGAGVAACKAVLEKEIDRAFIVMRPPGHHAERNRAKGFCLFNNIAVAAAWLRAEAGVKKVAIVDFDVHHGNGTQNAFYNDDTVYYASLHQYPLFPGTGFPEERGKNNTNLNIQMPPGCNPDLWLTTIKDMVLPELETFQPDFVLFSAGFDAHKRDPLGNQLLETEHFGEITALLKDLGQGATISFLEGGYHLEALAQSALLHYKILDEQ